MAPARKKQAQISPIFTSIFELLPKFSRFFRKSDGFEKLQKKAGLREPCIFRIPLLATRYRFYFSSS
jgi:hypothetical protein